MHYDAAGRVVAKIRYATQIAYAAVTASTSAAQVEAMLTPGASDQIEYSVHDAAGHLRYTISGKGIVSMIGYDGAGRETLIREFSVAIPIDTALKGKLVGGTATESDFAIFVANNSATARAEYRVYDRAGRVRYVVARFDATQGTVTGSRYDAAGQVTESSRYGQLVAFDPSDTEAELDALLGGAVKRTTRYFHDSAGRLRFEIDAENAVIERRYDGAGRQGSLRLYSVLLGSGNYTLSDLVLWASSQPEDKYRLNMNGFDAAGRISLSTDGVSGESYGYDGVGRMITRKDRNGHIWRYEYDATGRLVAEFTPTVSVATLDAQGNVVSTSRSIVTRYIYDAFGNVTRKTEDADNVSSVDRRVTDYIYDNRGNLIRTMLNAPGEINPANGAFVETTDRPFVEVTYDTLGRAVVERGLTGGYRYRIYDDFGRLAYDVDENNQVTSYDYNAWGEQTLLRRHAIAANLGSIPGWTQGGVISYEQIRSVGVLVQDGKDRTVTTLYDALGRKKSVVMSSIAYVTASGTNAAGAPERRFEYNAYGDLYKESILLEGVADTGSAVWADTWRYYDRNGRNTWVVDAGMYATRHSYSATGEVTETVEYARALASVPPQGSEVQAPGPGNDAIGHDRVSSWSYDAAGRKLTESVTRRVKHVDGSTRVESLRTAYTYDGEGHVLTVTDGNNVTRMEYDEVGHTRYVKEAQRQVVSAGTNTGLFTPINVDLSSSTVYQLRSPLTTMEYDGLGNLVRTVRYADGIVPDDDVKNSPPIGANDQVSISRYDHLGREVMTIDAVGHRVYSKYDSANRLTRRWYTLDGSEAASHRIVEVNISYDLAGRQTDFSQTRRRSGEQTVTYDLDEHVIYNAFGEVTGKTHGGVIGQLSYEYDNAGRMTSTNESGATELLGYNLAGGLVKRSRTAYLSSGAATTAVTRMLLDKLGRAVKVILPSHTANTSITSTIEQGFDRWNNVLWMVDARGYRTDYEYNETNQVLRTIRPLTKVVSETGVTTWERPENRWYYDAHGRLTATRDANGNIRRYEYDDVGRSIKSYDALGNATLYAYDALGNERYQQNPLGRITFSERDQLGRVVAIGDYMLSTDGASRVYGRNQTYTLNAHGDRLKTENALGYFSYADYDSRQKMIRSRNHLGDYIVDYTYDTLGRKILEHRGYDQNPGDTPPAQLDRENQLVNAYELTWSYDIHGRSLDHNNLSGRDSDYFYDTGVPGYTASGQLIADAQLSPGEASTLEARRTYTYYANGKIREIIESSGGRTRYEYDAAGNRTVEEVSGIDGYGGQYHTLTRTYYDSNNRVERVTQDDRITNKRIFDHVTEYDANGNRRHVSAWSGYGPNIGAVPANNRAPVVIKPIDDISLRKGRQVTFTLRMSDFIRDPDQDGLSFAVTKSDGSALPSWLTYTVDSLNGLVVFSANPGVALSDADFDVRVTAQEVGSGGLSVSDNFHVRLRNATAPQAVSSTTIQLRGKTGESWNFDVLASQYFKDTDVGDALTLTLGSHHALVEADGLGTDALRLHMDTTNNGVYTFTVIATDADGLSTSQNFSLILADNAAPAVAQALAPVTAIIPRSVDWSKSLSSVFTDIDGDRLQVRAALPGGLPLPSWLTFQHLADQAVPELRLVGTVPDNAQDGQVYQIVLTATDTDGASASTSLMLTLRANRAPVPTTTLKVLDDVYVGGHRTFSLPWSSLFVDGEGDDMSILYRAPVALPGWLSVSVNSATKMVTVQADPTTTGTFEFFLDAKDAYGQQSSMQVRITSRNDISQHSPIRVGSVALNDMTLVAGQSFSVTLPDGLFSDPDPGDVLTLAMHQMLEEGEGGGWSPVGAPGWMSFNPTTRVITGIAPSTPQVLHLRIEARDGSGNPDNLYESTTIGVNSTEDTDILVTITGSGGSTNHPPTYTAGSLSSVNVSAGQSVLIVPPQGAFVDPDNHPLTYSAAIQVGGQWQVLPNYGMVVDPATGRITGTLTGLASGSYAMRIMASDGQSSAYGEFSLIVGAISNTAPFVNRPIDPITVVPGGQPVVFDLPFDTFLDPEGDQLYYSVTKPAWVSFDPATLRFTVAPNSSVMYDGYPITVTARDRQTGGLSVSTTFYVYVEETTGGGTIDLPPVNLDPSGGELESDKEDVGDGDGDVISLPSPMPPAPAILVAPQFKEEWFTYDAENRLRITGGMFDQAGSRIILSETNLDSYEHLYDAGGNLIARALRRDSRSILHRSIFDLRGRKLYDINQEYVGADQDPTLQSGGIGRHYIYDAADRLVEMRSYYANNTTVPGPPGHPGEPNEDPMDISGWLAEVQQITYDENGRVIRDFVRRRKDGIRGIPWQAPRDIEIARQRQDATLLTDESDTHYTTAAGASGYDRHGRLATYRYRSTAINNTITTYTTQYVGWEDYREKTVTGTNSQPSSNPTTTNTLTYDGFGRLIKQQDHIDMSGSPPDRARGYVYNADGMVVQRREGKYANNTFSQDGDVNTGAKPNYVFVHAAGQQQAELKEGGTIRYNGADVGTNQIQVLNARGGYAAGGGMSTVLQGDNLRILAQRVYGSSNLWYVIGDANGLSDPEAMLTAGTQLVTPPTSVNANDSGTFRPYNPAEAIGPTSPSLPHLSAPPKQGCNAIAIILMVVVAVAVTVFTAGLAAAPAGSSVGAIMGAGTTVMTGGLTAAGFGATAFGAITSVGLGAFAGSVASQAVGSLLGVTSFSWRNALASGVTAALTAGIGSTGLLEPTSITALGGTGNAMLTAARSAAINTVASHVGNRIVGVDSSFSWRAVAASAVGAAITAGVAPRLTKAFDASTSSGRLNGLLTTRISGGLIGAYTNKVFGAAKSVDFGAVIAESIGEAIGDFYTTPPAPEARPISVSGDKPGLDGVVIGGVNYQGSLSGRDLVAEMRRLGIEPTQENMYQFLADSGRIPSNLPSARKNNGSGASRYAYPSVIDALRDSDGARREFPDLFANTLAYALYHAAEGADLPIPTLDASILTLARINEYALLEHDLAHQHRNSASPPPDLPPSIAATDAERSWGEQAQYNAAQFRKSIMDGLHHMGEVGAGDMLTVAASVLEVPARAGLAVTEVGTAFVTLADPVVRNNTVLGFKYLAAHPQALGHAVVDYARNHAWYEMTADGLVMTGSAVMSGGANILKPFTKGAELTARLVVRSAAPHAQRMVLRAGLAVGTNTADTVRIASYMRTAGQAVTTIEARAIGVGRHARIAAVSAERAANSGRTYHVNSGGARGEVPLSAAQRAEVDAYLQKFDLDGVAVRHVDDTNLNTGYAHGDLFSILNIGSDVVPGNVGLGTLTANSRVSLRGTLAHEIVGHREAALAERTQSILSLEEAQASIRAARFAPELTSTERFTLLRDGITRLHSDGKRIRDFRDFLFIDKR